MSFATPGTEMTPLAGAKRPRDDDELPRTVARPPHPRPWPVEIDLVTDSEDELDRKGLPAECPHCGDDLKKLGPLRTERHIMRCSRA